MNSTLLLFLVVAVPMIHGIDHPDYDSGPHDCGTSFSSHPRTTPDFVYESCVAQAEAQGKGVPQSPNWTVDPLGVRETPKGPKCLNQEPLGPLVSVPFGPAVSLDGKLEKAEWSKATRVDFGGSGEILFLSNGPELQVGVRGGTSGFPHLALSDGESAWFLHASAALGIIIYERDPETGSWLAKQSPVWEMRDTTSSPEAIEARRAYLALNGWVATTGRMGTLGETEFLIRLDHFGGPKTRIAMAFMTGSSGGSLPRWPSVVPDDTNIPRLLGGGTPDPLDLRLEGWARLAFFDGRKPGGGICSFWPDP